MEQSQSIAQLAPALVAAAAELRTIGYDSENPHFKSRFASLTAITETVRPILAKHALALLGGSIPHTGDGGTLVALCVQTTLVHASGEWVQTGVTVPLDKQTPQAAGIAMTYGRRYGISALLALATDEDTDGEHRTHQQDSVKSAPKAAPARADAAPRADLPAKGAKGPVVPFGDLKGTPLAELETPKLDKLIEWCEAKEDRVAKFAELIQNIRLELAGRGVKQAPDDDLPF